MGFPWAGVRAPLGVTSTARASCRGAPGGRGIRGAPSQGPGQAARGARAGGASGVPGVEPGRGKGAAFPLSGRRSLEAAAPHWDRRRGGAGREGRVVGGGGGVGGGAATSDQSWRNRRAK